MTLRTSKILRFLVAATLSAAGLSSANPTVFLPTVSKEEIQSKLDQLNQYKARTDLDLETRQKLTNLWSEAQTIQELNDRCNEISLSEELDNECSSFYQVTLPKFENQYQQLTGEIRLNGTMLVKSITDKREAIETCYESLPLHNWTPERWLKMEGYATPEPLSDGVEVTYSFSVGPDDNKKDTWNRQIEMWFRACDEVIFRTDNKNELAPLFIEKMNKNSEGKYLEFKLSSNKKNFDIFLKKGFSATYTLNGKELFIYSMDSGEKIGLFFLEKPQDYSILSLQFASEYYDGKENYSERKIKKGLEGHIVWGKYRKPTKVVTYGYSYSENPQAPKENNYAESKQSDENTLNTDRKYGFHFQFNTGLMMSFLSPSEGVKQEFEGTINPDSTEMFTWPMIAKLRYYGGAGVIGIGGGIAPSWLVTEEERTVNTYITVDGEETSSESKSTLLDFFFAPAAMVELAIGRDVELGVRGMFLFHPDRPTLMLGGTNKY